MLINFTITGKPVTISMTESQIENGDWDKYLDHYDFSMDLLEELLSMTGSNEDSSLWFTITQTQELTEEFIMKYEHLVDWDGVVVYNSQLSDEFIQANMDKFNWEEISTWYHWDGDFLRKYADHIDFDAIIDSGTHVEWLYYNMKKYLDLFTDEQILRYISDEDWPDADFCNDPAVIARVGHIEIKSKEYKEE